MSIQTRLLSAKLDIPEAVTQDSNRSLLSPFNRLDPRRYPCLLASNASPGNTDDSDHSQYDILFSFPQYQLILEADHSLYCSDQNMPLCSDFLSSLESCYQSEHIADTGDTLQLPFTGGWFVYLAYEMATEIEPCLTLPDLPTAYPLAIALRVPAAIIHDRRKGEIIAVAEQEYAHLLDVLEQDCHSVFQSSAGSSTSPHITLSVLEEADPEPYLEQVDSIKQYIIDGDIFQANLSRLWQATLATAVDDCALFDALSIQNPSSFAALASLQNMSIISSSPERLVSTRNGIVETRPIAGTRRRDDDDRQDAALAEELLQHPKEQAEHIMLIDLERNDLGRVCRPGSIEVNELMVLESWQHVHHIVSNVRGELDEGRSPVDVLRAVFPGGTITGCPKVHCIEILAEMEQQARGAYTGSLGYINRNGDMDFNILIRTMVRDTSAHDTGTRISFRAGGGIVSDSVADRELAETRAKAKGLLNIFRQQSSH